MAFTQEQNAALDAQGRVIVSASAGSGKTTVMIEKIIRLIQKGTDVGEILAVTFTKKAAAQMKEKLCKVLIENINADGVTEAERATLKKQLSEVPSADISTIHSFCAKLIRSHFYAAGVDSGFRVIGGDDAEGVALKNQALDEALEEGYEGAEEDFNHLLSVYWRKKSDNTLRKIFSKVYASLRDRADYREYLASSVYDEGAFDSICRRLYAKFCEKCAYYEDLLIDERVYFEGVGSRAQIALCEELCAWLTELQQAGDYFALRAIPQPKLTVNRGSKKDENNKLHIERLGFLRARVLDAVGKETGKLEEREIELARFLRAGRTAKALGKYLLQFDDKYAQLKREKGVLDFNDLEHITLALLSDEEIVAEVREKYRYVFVDEYQDVNPVQEAIISRVGGENLFLVGDVKQSIYGFRGSKSRFFVEKQRAFEDGEGKSLHMTRNFRSSDAVLDAVNAQFVLAMTPQVCDVDYARGSVMERGGRYALNSGNVQIHFLGKEEKKPAKERGVYSVKEHTGKAERENSLAANAILQIIKDERRKKWFNPDNGEWQEVKYSDIAILSRKMKGAIAETVAALSDAGIPITAGAAVNVCDYAEVKTLVDILSLLDNGEQDIPLCSALLSAMGGLTADDLAEIRLAYKQEKTFRAACRKYAEEKQDLLSEKLRAFFAYYQKVRTLTQVFNAGEILTLLLAETRMESRLLQRDNGASCLRRLRRFIEETNTPEPLSVHAFLNRLRDLEYKIEYSENGGEDSVKVMTMHSSKGLEFPVVILDDMSAPFHGVDADEVFVQEEYGLAPRAFDENNMTKAPTLLRRLYEVQEGESAVADGLNLYYVALTRAKYALHMLFTERSVMSDVKYAKSYADLTDFSVWEKYFADELTPNPTKEERTALVFKPDEGLVQRIMRAFTWRYPFAGYENLMVKSSASRLLALRDSDKIEESPTLLDVGFGKEAVDAELSFEEGSSDGQTQDAQAVGTAYHAFLENFDFSLLYSGATPVSKWELEEIVAQAWTAFSVREEEMAALVQKSKLVEILSNPVFYELQGCTLHKERQFLVSLPARETYALAGQILPDVEGAEEEEVIFQGAIDLLAIGEEVRIIDYKYSGGSAEYLKTHYKPQLELYRKATAKILRIGEEKIRCTIVNIRTGVQVDVE